MTTSRYQYIKRYVRYPGHCFAAVCLQHAVYFIMEECVAILGIQKNHWKGWLCCRFYCRESGRTATNSCNWGPHTANEIVVVQWLGYTLKWDTMVPDRKTVNLQSSNVVYDTQALTVSLIENVFLYKTMTIRWCTVQSDCRKRSKQQDNMLTVS